MPVGGLPCALLCVRPWEVEVEEGIEPTFERFCSDLWREEGSLDSSAWPEKGAHTKRGLEGSTNYKSWKEPQRALQVRSGQWTKLKSPDQCQVTQPISPVYFPFQLTPNKPPFLVNLSAILAAKINNRGALFTRRFWKPEQERTYHQRTQVQQDVTFMSWEVQPSQNTFTTSEQIPFWSNPLRVQKSGRKSSFVLCIYMSSSVAYFMLLEEKEIST